MSVEPVQACRYPIPGVATGLITGAVTAVALRVLGQLHPINASIGGAAVGIPLGTLASLGAKPPPPPPRPPRPIDIKGSYARQAALDPSKAHGVSIPIQETQRDEIGWGDTWRCSLTLFDTIEQELAKDKIHPQTKTPISMHDLARWGEWEKGQQLHPVDIAELLYVMLDERYDEADTLANRIHPDGTFWAAPSRIQGVVDLMESHPNWNLERLEQALHAPLLEEVEEVCRRLGCSPQSDQGRAASTLLALFDTLNDPLPVGEELGLNIPLLAHDGKQCSLILGYYFEEDDATHFFFGDPNGDSGWRRLGHQRYTMVGFHIDPVDFPASPPRARTSQRS